MRRARAHGSGGADPELRAVLPSIPAGGLTTLLVVLAAVPYLATTREEANREAIALLLAIAGVLALAIMAAPRERILGSRLRDPFFLAWTVIDAAMIVAVASLDGGVGSPFTVLLFLTQAFAAVFYPFRLVVVGAAVNLVALTAIAAFGGGELTETWFVGAALVGTSILCGWQAHTSGEQRRELARASRSDALTGCLNRRGFEERLAEEVTRSERSSAPFVVVILDIDDFKQVNDELGHAAGDDLLRQIVAAMARVVRGMDSIGRLGGDEFALLFPDADCDQLEVLERRVERAVTPHAPCSLGAACFPAEARDPDELLRRADLAMYRRKRELDSIAAGLQEVSTGSSRTTSAAGLSSRRPL